MEEIRLKAEPRPGKSTKRELSVLRRDRLIPAVVYGGDGPPMNVVVHEKELHKATQRGGANVIIRLQHPTGEDTVILKQLQHHVVTHQPLHADFQRISLKEKIEVRVPLHVVGEAPGVKLHGGVLEHVLRELKIRAFPTAIPPRIDVDVSLLDVNQSVLVRDVPSPAGVEVLDAPDHIVLNVVQPTAEEVAPAAETATGGAEPEVIAKGKKETAEGAEGAAPAAKGAAPVPEKKEGR